MLLLRIVGMLGYVVLTIIILGFIFSNRSEIAVDFFPFGHADAVPLYILLAILFVAGLLVGLIHSFTLWASMRRKLARANRTIAELEKEIALRQSSTL